MKLFFINAYSKKDVLPLVKKIKVSERLGLLTTAQYTNQLDTIHKAIPKSVIGGQIIGCEAHNALKIKDQVDSFLYIGTGKFHPIEIALATEKEVYLLNPESETFSKLKKTEIKDYEKRKIGLKTRFLSAEKIGILITTKPGQYHPKQYLDLQQKIDTIKKVKALKDKELHLFLFNKLNPTELENYPDIDCWVNTACPRLKDDFLDKAVINLSEINTLK